MTPLRTAKMNKMHHECPNHFSNVEVYILIILDFLGKMAVYVVLRFHYSFLPFQGYFGHFRCFQIILVVLETLRLFWSSKRFQGIFFRHFVVSGVFW